MVFSMFESLSSKISNAFSKIRKGPVVTAANIEDALKEIRIALLEADVPVEVVKEFFEKVKVDALGERVLKNISPEKMVVEVVYNNMFNILKNDDDLKIPYEKPFKIMLVGLQGAGKTTTAAKLVQYFAKQNLKKAFLTSVDIYRPAAIEQLHMLSESVGAEFFDADPSKDKPLDILKNAEKIGNKKDLFILDTAGRLHTDDAMMEELCALKMEFNPHEVFLVADSMTGQDSLRIAKEFNEKVGITGVILTRMDGDPRGGAALSMKFVTGKPIRFIGNGEKSDGLEKFHPDRIAQKILGMGDVLSLIEKAREASSEDDDMALAKKIQSGKFDLNDFAKQFSKINKMGGILNVIKYLPGLQNASAMLQNRGIDDSMITKKLAMISSMTKAERKNPDIIKSSRKTRITKGSGTTIQDLNKLLTEFNQMKEMMRRLQKMSRGDMMQMMKSFMK